MLLSWKIIQPAGEENNFLVTMQAGKTQFESAFLTEACGKEKLQKCALLMQHNGFQHTTKQLKLDVKAEETLLSKTLL